MLGTLAQIQFSKFSDMQRFCEHVLGVDLSRPCCNLCKHLKKGDEFQQGVLTTVKKNFSQGVVFLRNSRPSSSALWTLASECLAGSKSPFKGFDHIHFWVGNARQAAVYYITRFGFQPCAYRGLESRPPPNIPQPWVGHNHQYRWNTYRAQGLI